MREFEQEVIGGWAIPFPKNSVNLACVILAKLWKASFSVHLLIWSLKGNTASHVPRIYRSSCPTCPKLHDVYFMLEYGSVSPVLSKVEMSSRVTRSIRGISLSLRRDTMISRNLPIT